MDIYIAGIYFLIMSLLLNLSDFWWFLGLASLGFIGIVVIRRERALLFTILTVLFILRVSLGVNFREYKKGEVADIFVKTGKRSTITRIDGKIPRSRKYLKESMGSRGDYRIKGKIIEVKDLKNSKLYEVEIYKKEKIEDSGIRTFLGGRIDELLKGYSRGLKGFYRGIIMGDKENLDKTLKEKFAYTGTSHLIVISGLHIGVIIALIMYLSSKLPVSHDMRYIVVIIILSLYVMAVGFSPSVLRAYIMGLCYLGGGLFYEEPDGRKSFFTAMTVNLLADPLGGGSISFQMSYMAVFSILFIYPKVEKRLKIPERFGFFKWVTMMAALSFVIQSALTPIFMMNFRTIPLLSFIVNILAIPLGVFFVQASFGALLLSMMNIGWIIMPAVNLFYYILKTFIYSAAKLPLLSLEYSGVASGWYLILIYTGMLVLLYGRKKVYSLISVIVILMGMRERGTDYRGDEYSYYAGYPEVVVANRKLDRWDVEEMWNNRIRKVEVMISGRIQSEEVGEKLKINEVIILKDGEGVKVGEYIFENKEGRINREYGFEK